MDIAFRSAEGTDIDTLVKLMQEYYTYDHLSFDRGIARRALKQLIHDASLGGIWLICCADEVMGYIILTLGYSLEYHGRDAFIDEFYIRKSSQGRGVGLRTVQFVEEVCRSLGVHALHLEVERENVRAQAFYRKARFEDHDRYLMTKWISGGSNTQEV